MRHERGIIEKLSIIRYIGVDREETLAENKLSHPLALERGGAHISTR